MRKNISFTLPFIVAAASNAYAGHVQYKTVLTPAGSFTSESSSVDGDATVNGDACAAPLVTVKLDTLKSGVDLRDEHMLKKYLESDKYPVATVKDVKGTKGHFTGTLNLHGQNHPIEGTYKSDGHELTADFTAKMSDYGITKPSYMGVGAKDEIAVEATLPVTAQASAKP